MAKEPCTRENYATRSRGLPIEVKKEITEGSTELPLVPSQLLIAIDPGTECTKAAYKVIIGSNSRCPTAPQPSSINDIKAVIWPPGLSDHVKSHVSYTKNNVTDEPEFRWGHEVDQALRQGLIEVTNIIRDLKPAVFEKDDGRTRRTLDQISHLPPLPQQESLSERLQKHGQNTDGIEITALQLFVWSMQRALWVVLRRVAEDRPELGIPVYRTYTSRYGDWEPNPNLEILFTIPLPAASSPDQTTRIIAACAAAGLCDPHPVAEPLGMLALQLKIEGGSDMLEKRIAILDMGAATTDSQIHDVTGTAPVKVRQVGGFGTVWGGGSGIDQKCADYISEKNPGLIVCLGTQQNPSKLRYEFLHAIEKEFNDQKTFFDGDNELVLIIPGLPGIAGSRMIHNGKIILSPEDVANIFRPTIEAVWSQLSAMLGEARTTGPVDELMMGGGGSLSLYIRDEIESRLDRFDNTIVFRHPSDQTSGSSTVAKGAVELLSNRALISMRTVNYGYAVAQLKPTDELPGQHFPDDCVVPSGIDRENRVNVSRFFFKAGDSLPLEYEAPHFLGFRQLHMREDKITTENFRSFWHIEETLYYCADTQKCVDNLAVEDEDNEIIEMPMKLECNIPLSAADHWMEVTQDDEIYFEIEYEVVLHLDGERLRFEVLIPRGGVFDPNDRESDMSLEVQYNVAGIFDLVK